MRYVEYVSILLILSLPSAAGAQAFSQRGFAEALVDAYPQTGVRDDTQVVADSLFRWEPSLKAGSWRFDASFDARMDSHDMTQRTAEVTFWDRTIQRPALAVSRLSVSWAHGPVTFVAGKQFVRWGKTDILVPTDRFAPRDYLNVIEPQLLAITAARLTIGNSSDSIDAVYAPRLTPSRAPLLDQRWVAIPPAAGNLTIVDDGALYPSRSQAGVRWNHIGRRFEHSLSFYRGSNHLPWFEASLQGTAPPQVAVRRRYAQLTTVGADVAVPLPVFTVKAEAAWFHSDTARAGEYMLYVVQVERQSGEWLFVAGIRGRVRETADAARRLSAGSRADARLHRARVGHARCQSQPRVRKCHPAERRWILRAGGVLARLRRPLARHRQRHRVRRDGRRFPGTLRPQLVCAPAAAIQLLTRPDVLQPCHTPTIRVGTFRRRPSYLLVSRRR